MLQLRSIPIISLMALVLLVGAMMPSTATATSLSRPNAVLNPTISGNWNYLDKTNTSAPLRYAFVEILVQAGATYITKGTGFTGLNGEFTIPTTLTGENFLVRVSALDQCGFRVSDNPVTGYSYQHSSAMQAGTNTFLGTNVVNTNREAWWIFQKISYQAWNYLFANANYNVCASDLQAIWFTNNSIGSLYNGVIQGNGFKTIYIRGFDGFFEDVILHEFGHYVQHKVYGTYAPSNVANCIPHSWEQTTSLGCAWSEGWASYFSSAVQNDPINVQGNGVTFNIEIAPSSNSGSSVEASVGVSLWDVYDSGSAEAWDRLARGFNGTNNNGTWRVFTETKPASILAFRDGWYGSPNKANCQVSRILEAHSIYGIPRRCTFLPMLRK